jgi:hypothetical protein
VLKGLITGSPVSRQTPFDPTGTEFVATNAQDAIIEATELAQGKARYALMLLNNGSYTNGQWVGYSELLPGNNTPIVFPVPVHIKEITFSNNNTNCEFNFTFRLGTTGATPYRTWTVDTNTEKTATLSGIDDAIPAASTADDRIFIQYNKTGGSTASDVALILYVEVD